jgi:N-acetylmuramoyl-L-alanine amidase CwlA
MSLTGTTNEEKIWNYLKAKGLTNAGVAGLMGNLYAESGLSPTNLQNSYEKSLGYTDASYTSAVDSGKYKNFAKDSAGYGLCQWTYWSRKEALLAYAKAAGKSIGDLETQLGFLMQELTNSYKAVLSTLKSASSVRTASDAVLLQFERPADQSESVKTKRAGYGQVYYDKYAAATSSTAANTAKKEVSSLKLVQSIMTKNPCYTAGKKITVKGLMLHSVGCSQPSASVCIKNWNTASYKNACVHGFIDANDGTVYQTLPWNHRGWHAGGSANNTHIGVEMCEPACIKYTSGANFTCSDKATAQACVKRTYESAVALFAMLCKEYNLDPLTAICSHKEGCAKGIASNHGDPEHLWNGLGMSYTMDGFRKDVKAAMGSTTTSTTAQAASATQTSASSTFKSYSVRVTASVLNIRKGPGTGYATTGSIKDKGVYTIVAESTGTGATKWGKLKSGAGWISLDYCKKV